MSASLRDALMKKLGGMSAAGQGIFNEDVTALLKHYFPKGQKLEETRRVARDNGLGELEPFMGRKMPQAGEMYVTRVPLMNAKMSDVFIVLQFAFMPNTDGPALDRVGGFLRSNAM